MQVWNMNRKELSDRYSDVSFASSCRPRWQRGQNGGGPSCQRRSQGPPGSRVRPARTDQTLTLLPKRSPKRPRAPLSSLCPNKSPPTAPASSATRPTTTPTSNPCSTSRLAAETWTCPARAGSNWRGGCARDLPWRIKTVKTWRRRTTFGDRWRRRGDRKVQSWLHKDAEEKASFPRGVRTILLGWWWGRWRGAERTWKGSQQRWVHIPFWYRAHRVRLCGVSSSLCNISAFYMIMTFNRCKWRTCLLRTCFYETVGRPWGMFVKLSMIW